MKMALTNSIFATSMFLFSLVVVASAGGVYGPNPGPEKPEPEQKEKSLSANLGIQGIIYCQSGSEFTPLEGAVARITCLAIDEHGYENAPFSILSDATDAKGYFFAKLSPSEVQRNWRLKECKAFLELSPSETCNVPTDMNNGTSGALLADYRLLNNKNMILFSLRPFCFTSDHKSNSNGY